MNKMKRLFAGLLALVLTVVMLPAQTTMTVWADTMPTIDTDEEGSLTIHKYEYNETGGTATGSASDSASVPTGATPLAGVTFKVTKVYELGDYYGVEDKSLPTVALAKGVVKSDSESSDFNTLGNWMTITTAIINGDAIAKLEELPLGIYLVEEIDAPAQITGKTTDFLVSIPMTNANEDGWIYDVHVFPKNQSTYAGVNLVKYGNVGNGTETLLPGAEFILQRGVDADDNDQYEDSEWSTVTTNNKGDTIGVDGVLTTAEGKISVADLAPGRYRFVEQAVPSNTGYILDKKSVYEFEIGDDGEVYLVDSNGDVAGSSTDTVQYPIKVVNYKPAVEKVVKDRTGNWGNAADYSIGDNIPYRIKVDVPSNISELRNFTLTDTMTNQTMVAGTFKICSDDSCENEILNGSYTKPEAGTGTWTVPFNTFDSGTGAITSLLQAYADQSVYVYFEAKLTESAVNTSEGNKNEIKLEYSNTILPVTKKDTPVESDIITDEAIVYTFKIEVTKTGNTGTDSVPLQYVEFNLYRKINEGEAETGLTLSGLDGTYVKVNEEPLVTGADGKLSVNGLENGTYYLVETKTNDGYNLLKAPVEVQISADYAAESETVITKDGNTGITTTETTVTTNKFDYAGTNGVFTTTIVNNKGFTLPVTGGMGMFSFIIVGVSMMIAAVVLLITSKKKEATNK